MTSLDIIRNQFIALEKKYDVYNQTIDGIYFWKLLRMDLFSDITTALGVVNESHPSNYSDMVKRGGRLLWYSSLAFLKHNSIEKSDVLVLTHGRKINNQGSFIDIYVDDFIKQTKEEGKKIFIIDRPDHYGKHYPISYGNFTYYERFGHLIRECPFPLIKIENEKRTLLLNIEQDIRHDFGIHVNLVRFTRKKLFRFYSEKKYFGKILDSVKPEMVFLTVSYGKEDLIAAAKERGIPTAEFQHGIISTFHMGYYFPNATDIPYFPDKLILFGDFWKDSVQYPVNCKLEVAPFQWLQKDTVFIKEDKKEEVLFISQGTIGKKLSEIAAEFSIKSDMKCYYKLHPSEFTIWKERYKKLLNASEAGHIIVISQQMTIYQLFQQCRYAVGVYSTSIYEALMYGCTTFSVKLQGYQYMEYLIENHYIRLLPEQFCDNDLKQDECVSIPDSTYFYSSQRKYHED